MTVAVRALAAVLPAGATDAPAAQAPKPGEAPRATSAETLARRAGKAGFYLGLPEQQRARDPEFYLSHPLVDAVVINFGWSDIEPRPGEFNAALAKVRESRTPSPLGGGGRLRGRES